MPILQVGGLTSGLDTNAIIDQLIAIAERPKASLESRLNELQAQKMSFEMINAGLLMLQSRASLLSDGDILSSNKVTSSDTSIISAAISSSVNPAEVALGTYEISITQLAEPAKTISGSRISGTIDTTKTVDNAGFRITPTSGKFTINGVEITIDATTQAIGGVDGVIETINGALVAAGVDVRARYGTTGIEEDKIVIENTVGGVPDPSNNDAITLGATTDTSNFLSAAGLLNAAQEGHFIKSLSWIGAINLNSPLVEANTATTVSSGSFSINDVEITIDVNNDSLQSIINKINASQAGVNANYNMLEDELELTSYIGTARIRLEDDTSNFLAAMDLTTVGGTEGQTAEFTVNGTTVSQNTNTGISNVIPGITFDLLGDVGDEATITVERDVDSAVSAIEKFIKEYNSLQEVLRNDTSMSGLSRNIFNLSIRNIGGLPANFNRLSHIGIGRAVPNTVTVDRIKRGLELTILDESKLRTALMSNPTAVADLFSISGSGEEVALNKAFQLASPALNGSTEIVISGDARKAPLLEIGDEITILGGRISEEHDVVDINYHTLNDAGWGIMPTSGKFSINGKEIEIVVAEDDIYEVVDAINGAGAGVKAFYDYQTGRLTLRNLTDGDTSPIEFSVPDDETASNFLTAAGWLNAKQTLITTDPETGEPITGPEELLPTNSVSSNVGIGRTTITLDDALTNDYTTSAVVGRRAETMLYSNAATTVDITTPALAAGSTTGSLTVDDANALALASLLTENISSPTLIIHDDSANTDVTLTINSIDFDAGSITFDSSAAITLDLAGGDTIKAADGSAITFSIADATAISEGSNTLTGAAIDNLPDLASSTIVNVTDTEVTIRGMLLNLDSIDFDNNSITISHAGTTEHIFDTDVIHGFDGFTSTGVSVYAPITAGNLTNANFDVVDTSNLMKGAKIAIKDSAGDLKATLTINSVVGGTTIEVTGTVYEDINLGDSIYFAAPEAGETEIVVADVDNFGGFKIGDTITIGSNGEQATIDEIGERAGNVAILILSEGLENAHSLGEEVKIYGDTLNQESVGFAAGVEKLLKTYTNINTGVVKGRLRTYNQQIKNAQERMERFVDKIEQKREKYVAEFAKLERALSVLQSQSSFISQQLSSLQNSLLYSYSSTRRFGAYQL